MRCREQWGQFCKGWVKFPIDGWEWCIFVAAQNITELAGADKLPAELQGCDWCCPERAGKRSYYRARAPGCRMRPLLPHVSPFLGI